MSLKRSVRPKFDRSRGASLVEYLLLVALIAVVGIPCIQTFGTYTAARFVGQPGSEFQVVLGAGHILQN